MLYRVTFCLCIVGSPCLNIGRLRETSFNWCLIWENEKFTSYSPFHNTTGLFKRKYTHSKFYFTKITDAKSMSCVWMERKSLKVLISMI
jgi:hypothetical protein